MPALQLLIDGYINTAREAPDPASVLRAAANDFGKFAMHPKNARMSVQLKNVAMEFAMFASKVKPRRPPTADDFEDLMHETQMAIEEVGDEDQMAIIARQREIHDERSGDAPRVSISPESFNVNATLGRSATIKYAPSQEDIANDIVQTQTVAFWQGVKREAQAVTVDIGFTLTPDPSLDASYNIRPYAIVEYGSDGNKTARRVDVGFGQRLTVVGNYVSVLVGMAPPMVGKTNVPVTVGASIGAFAAPSSCPVILTEYIDQLDGGGDSDRLVRPQGAMQLLPLVTDLALGETAILTFYGYGVGGGVILNAFYQQSVNSVSPIPLPDDVAFVRIHNGAGSARNFRLPFQISM